MRSRHRAREYSRVGRPRSLRLALVRLSAVALLALALGAAPRASSGAEPLRLVLASSAASSPARGVSTRALYAKNSPWKRYLASERVCPGGERTDLPRRRQAETVACLLNFARQTRGLRPLAVAPILNGASAKKAQQILRCGRFAHNPCGGDWAAPIKAVGYVGVFGENIYLASGPFAAPRPTVDAWLNSAPHRKNLFRPDWREQGLAGVSLPPSASSSRAVVWVNVLGDPGT